MEEHEHHDDGSVAVVEDREPDDGARLAEIPESVVKAARAGDDTVITPAEVLDATEWLFSDDTEAEPKRKVVHINLRPGTIVPWELRALTGAEFRQIRQAAMGNREERRKMFRDGDPTGMDENRYNVLVVAQATVKPNLAEVAARKGEHPVAIIQHRFMHLPGVVQHLAGIVNDLSGYDPELVDEEVAEAATGNS